MKPSRDDCKLQISRLLGKPFAPNTVGAIGELIDQLHKHAQSEDHARKVVDSFVSESSPCPEPGEVIARAWELREHETKPNASCEKCGGSGYAMVTYVIDQVPYDGSTRCECWQIVSVSA
jgi:hypothetical protein